MYVVPVDSQSSDPNELKQLLVFVPNCETNFLSNKVCNNRQLIEVRALDIKKFNVNNIYM